jgi:AcrR family transcriptional regulator
MARPVSITEEQILDAARDLFLKRGYSEATTAEIAREAGVSEGSLFKRFRGKKDLFRVAMDSELPEFIRDLPKQAGQGDPRANLTRFGLDTLTFFETHLPKLMMHWSHRFAMSSSAPRLRALAEVQAYLDAEMRLRRLRRANSEVLGRLLLGGLWNYVFVRTVVKEPSSVSREAYVRELVDVLWRGVAPRKGSR